MRKATAVSLGLLVLSAIAEAKSQRPMPTATLPFEPFSSDQEISAEEPPAVQNSQPLAPAVAAVQTESRALGSRHELGAALRVLMRREGFGGQVKLLEYLGPWLAMTQTLRYFANDPADPYYENRYGLSLGVEAHPWRRARLSPVMSLQVGGERFVREAQLNDEDLFMAEATAGVELQLNRFASFTLQWVGASYSQPQAPLFAAQESRRDVHQSIEVYFNLDWELTL